MTEFIGTSLGGFTAQLLPWDRCLIAMVTEGQSSHVCPWVHECVCVCVCAGISRKGVMSTNALIKKASDAARCI